VEIAVAELQRLFQRGRGAVKLFHERATAREIVKDQRAARFQLREMFIHLEALRVAAALRVVVAQQLQRVPRNRDRGGPAPPRIRFCVKVALADRLNFFLALLLNGIQHRQFSKPLPQVKRGHEIFYGILRCIVIKRVRIFRGIMKALSPALPDHRLEPRSRAGGTGTSREDAAAAGQRQARRRSRVQA